MNRNNDRPGACRRLLDRFVMWLGHKPKRRWLEYQKKHDGIIFFCRECMDTGARQVRSAGPMGDGQWKDESEAFRHDWERDWFDQAERIDT